MDADESSSLVVVGVGASAGGLDAFTQLLKHLPRNPGAAFVLVQHLDAKHESILPALLARATSMPVCEALDGATLLADQVHVIPPGNDVAVRDGHLRLVPRPKNRAPHMPFDLFLRTLAEAHGTRAMAVILSGTGTDGTLGCKAVSHAGGISFAQEPASAKYDGMPKSAIAAGCVDFVLPPDEIAREIVRLAREPYLRDAVAPPVAASGEAGSLRRIFARLKEATGSDFTCYKKTTLMRRIHRRMALHKIDDLDDYTALLDDGSEELLALHGDLLINVTSFFREPESFEALSRVIRGLLTGRAASAPVRIWVPGCASGEEAYSVAICLLEVLGELGANPPLQVFATDLSARAVDAARLGIYPDNIVADVSPERLRRFFTKSDGRYQVSKSVRDLIVFARQDLARDPPFSKLDLISCRNVLIYLEPSLQRIVLSAFHYALRPEGILVLGGSETAGTAAELFAVRDKVHKIYAKVAGAKPALPTLATGLSSRDPVTAARPAGNGREAIAPLDVWREAERILLGHYAPAGVLVDDAGIVLHLRGDTEPYVGHPEGVATLNLLKLARKALAPDIRRLLERARETGTAQRKSDVAFRHRGRERRIAIEVLPVTGPASGSRSFLVLFDDRARARPSGVGSAGAKLRGDKAKDRRIAQLEQELQALHHHQQGLEEGHVAHAEELQSSNEEILSSNEELQSINEELETAKEELQSGNEELQTLNEELQNRNQELGRLNDDLDNLLASATIPLVMLDPHQRVRRFTPAAGELLDLVPADIGRPIGNLRLSVPADGPDSLVAKVLATSNVEDVEVQDRGGRWWRLLVRPYRTRDQTIDGAVLSFHDIDALKRHEAVVRQARDFADAIVATVREPLIVLDGELRIIRANPSFYETFRLAPGDAEGQSIDHVGDRQWDLPSLKTLLEEVVRHGRTFEDFVVEHDFPSIGPKTMALHARAFHPGVGAPLVLLAIEDRTAATRFEAERESMLVKAREATTAAETTNRLKEEFIATAAHELRGPLNALTNWAHVLAEGTIDDETKGRAIAAIIRSVQAQARLIDELLDVTRIMTGKLRIATLPVEIGAVLDAAIDSARPAAEAKGIDLRRGAGAGGIVLGDQDRLQQVAWNLISNAIKFTPKGGQVEVSAEASGTDIRIRVADSGQGIGADFLPFVFDRFRQADRGPARSQTGLGLGLAIVRQLGEMHGGRVAAESPGEGQGSTFVVSLPVSALRAVPKEVDDDGDDSAFALEATPEASALRGVRVFLVEDDIDNRESLETVLAQYGAEVTAVESAIGALAALAQAKPHVILSDIGLPGKDGYDLLREIRESGNDTPAIALTAYASKVDRQMASAAGFQAHLAKPAALTELVRTVAAVAKDGKR